MAGQPISNTNLEYDDDAYNNLPESRKNFGDLQTGISISNGIRTNADGTEIYMRVREAGETDVPYYESEINKTYTDSFYTDGGE